MLDKINIYIYIIYVIMIFNALTELLKNGMVYVILPELQP